MIYLEDGNTHVFTHQVVIALGTHSRSVECSLDLFAEKKQRMQYQFCLSLWLNLQRYQCLYPIELTTLNWYVKIKKIERTKIIQSRICKYHILKVEAVFTIPKSEWWILFFTIRQIAYISWRIAKYLESRSHMRCVFTGYYTEELRPEGGNQVPSCNFSGKGMVFRPYEEDAAASRTHSPNRRLSDVKPDTSNHTSMKKVKLFNGMPWKVLLSPWSRHLD